MSKFVVAMYRDSNRFAFFTDPVIFDREDNANSYARQKSIEYSRQFYVFRLVRSILYTPPPPKPEDNFIITEY